MKGSTLHTKGIFGGLVYQTSGYWKIGDGNTAGITFQGSNTLNGKTSKDSPSALLVADTSGVTQSSGTSGDADNGNAKTYLEILKDGKSKEEQAQIDRMVRMVSGYAKRAGK